MKKILLILIFILFLLVQLTGAGFLGLGGAVPNLVLALCLTAVILRGFGRSWWLFLIAGFLMDLYADLPFGLISLSLVLSLYLVDWLYQKIFSLQRFWTRAVLAAFGITAYYLFIFLGSSAFDFKMGFSFGFFVGGLSYNLILTILMLYGAEKIFYQKKTKANY